MGYENAVGDYDMDARDDEDLEDSSFRRADELVRFLDAIVDNIPAMVFVKDATELRFELFNRFGEDLLGMSRSKLLGKTDFDFFPEEQAAFFQAKDREVLAGGRLVDIPEEPIDTAGGRRWLHTKKIPLVDEHGVPRHLLGISLDITQRHEAEVALREAHQTLEERVRERTQELARSNEELKREIEERQRAEASLLRAEAQFRQAQKMEAIGRLAGGVAHDFNNLLTVILTYGAMILSDLRDADPLRGDITEIVKAAERAASLTEKLLAFSRKQVMSPRVVDLNKILDGMALMLQRIVGEDVAVTTRLAQGLALTKLDPSQVEQIVLNLVVNARDAMPSGGKLTIETSNVHLGESYAAEHVGVTPGPHVMLAVTDTGVGMDRETKANIFEPFFTTKERSKGTGLGLSMVLGAVQQSGGNIWVYSEPGKGTTFKLYFPSTRESLDEPEEVRPRGTVRGTETILLVEDEPQVRNAAREILRRLGYQVLDAQNAEEATLLCERFSGHIHLLLTDVIMPETSGRELAERLVVSRPDMKVLYVSGYTDNTIVHHGVLDAGVHFLQKPFTPETLGHKIREVLGSTAVGSTSEET